MQEILNIEITVLLKMTLSNRLISVTKNKHINI